VPQLLEQGFVWLMLMGGMQYQTEHHLFPQIPFYRLPEAESIITEHLNTQGKKNYVWAGALIRRFDI